MLLPPTTPRSLSLFQYPSSIHQSSTCLDTTNKPAAHPPFIRSRSLDGSRYLEHPYTPRCPKTTQTHRCSLYEHPDEAEYTPSIGTSRANSIHMHIRNDFPHIVHTILVPCTAARQATRHPSTSARSCPHATCHFMPKHPLTVREQTREVLSNEVPLA